MATLILLRHGESSWNAQDLFAGWCDIGLTTKGRREAAAAGALLRDRGLLPDVAHTSLLRRAISTAELALDAGNRSWVPIHKSWRLNERHYGALQGRARADVRRQYGDERFMHWRRSYEGRPPPLDDVAHRAEAKDERYASLSGSVPRSESLLDVTQRLLPHWYDTIVPDLAAGRRVLVSAHGNTIRALIKHLDHVPNHRLVAIDVPTAVPLRYELDSSTFSPIRPAEYLRDAD